MVSHLNTRALFHTCRLRHFFSIHSQPSPGDVSFPIICTRPFYTHFADFGKTSWTLFKRPIEFPISLFYYPERLWMLITKQNIARNWQRIINWSINWRTDRQTSLTIRNKQRSGNWQQQLSPRAPHRMLADAKTRHVVVWQLRQLDMAVRASCGHCKHEHTIDLEFKWSQGCLSGFWSSKKILFQFTLIKCRQVMHRPFILGLVLILWYEKRIHHTLHTLSYATCHYHKKSFLFTLQKSSFVHGGFKTLEKTCWKTPHSVE